MDSAAPPDAISWGRILQQELDRLFEVDPHIQELGFLLKVDPAIFGAAGPQEDAARADGWLSHPEEGPAFMLVKHSLGLGYWAVQPLCAAALVDLSEFRARWWRLVADREGLGQEAGLRMLAGRVLSVSRTICLVNADNYSVWNLRKRVFLFLQRAQSPADLISALLSEIKFLDLVFSKHPKCGESWSHRRWVLRLVCDSVPRLLAVTKGGGAAGQLEQLSLGSSKSLLFVAEWRCCDTAAERYSRNAYSWNHRLWLLKHLESAGDLLERLQVLQATWNDQHISDYSGFVCRQQILRMAVGKTNRHCDMFHPARFILGAQKLVADADAPLRGEVVELPDASESDTCLGCQVIASELRYLLDLFSLFGHHEGLWLHRRFVWLCQWRALLEHLAPLGMLRDADPALLAEPLLRLAEAAWMELPEVDGAAGAGQLEEETRQFQLRRLQFRQLVASDALIWAEASRDTDLLPLWQLRLQSDA